MGLLSRRLVLATAAAFSMAPAIVSADEAKLSVVATTGMIADAASAVGGDLVEVKALMGPGVDPHAYRQTRTDILAMTRADLVLWNGHYLEAQMEDFLGDLAARMQVVAAAELDPGIGFRRCHAEGHGTVNVIRLALGGVIVFG